MLLYLYERQQRDQVSRRTEIEQSGRNDLPWTPQNAPDIENVVQIGHLLEDNNLFYKMEAASLL